MWVREVACVAPVWRCVSEVFWFTVQLHRLREVDIGLSMFTKVAWLDS